MPTAFAVRTWGQDRLSDFAAKVTNSGSIDNEPKV